LCAACRRILCSMCTPCRTWCSRPTS
jgi:hypothetical protein